MRNPGGLDVGSKTPIESHRNEKGGIVIDVVVPVLQSGVVAILAAAAVQAFVNLIYDSGELPFWIGTGVVSLSAFLWVLRVQYSYGVTWLDGLAALLMSLIAGVFCWSFAAVITWSKRTWLNAWTFSAFVFLLVFYVHLEMTLLQRLAQPWQFQRQAIWKTLQDVATHWLKKEPEARPQQAPREITITKIDEATQSRTHKSPPVDNDTFEKVCRVLSTKTFTETNLCGNGNPLPGGARGRQVRDELRAWMIGEEYLRWNSVDSETGEGIPGQGVSLTAMGERLVDLAVEREQPTPL